jgi:hypothetical protein
MERNSDELSPAKRKAAAGDKHPLLLYARQDLNLRPLAPEANALIH